MAMKDLLKSALTEVDNKTWDMSKILAVFSVLSGLGMQGYSLLKGNVFDMQNFGTGIGALFAGVGVALGFKKDSNATTN